MRDPQIIARTEELLQMRNPSHPLIPDIEREAHEDETERLIGYWVDMLIEVEGYKRAPSTPYRFLPTELVLDYPSLLEEYIQIEADYFQHLIQDMGDNVEILEPEHQIIAQAACITNLKSIPSGYIYTIDDPEITKPEMHNFMSRNYDRTQVTTLDLGEMVKVRATYIDNDEVYWYFVTGLGGIFGWVRAEDMHSSVGKKSVDQAVESQYPENPRGLTVAHINVPFLQIGDEVTEVSELHTRSGLTLGSRIYGYQEGEHFVARLPVKRGGDTVLEKVRIPLSYVAGGYKHPKELVQDLVKFLGNPYAWGGNAVWRRREENPIYGLNDCSGIIRQVLKMYGIDLPANDSGQMRMGEVLVENLVDGKRKPLTDTQIEGFLQTEYKPGLTFFAYGGHIAIVISQPGQPLQLLHARFHRRVDKEGNFMTSQHEPLTLDKVVITDMHFPDWYEFMHSPKSFMYPSYPTRIWHLPV